MTSQFKTGTIVPLPAPHPDPSDSRDPLRELAALAGDDIASVHSSQASLCDLTEVLSPLSMGDVMACIDGSATSEQMQSLQFALTEIQEAHATGLSNGYEDLLQMVVRPPDKTRLEQAKINTELQSQLRLRLHELATPPRHAGDEKELFTETLRSLLSYFHARGVRLETQQGSFKPLAARLNERHPPPTATSTTDSMESVRSTLFPLATDSSSSVSPLSAGATERSAGESDPNPAAATPKLLPPLASGVAAAAPAPPSGIPRRTERSPRTPFPALEQAGLVSRQGDKPPGTVMHKKPFRP